MRNGMSLRAVLVFSLAAAIAAMLILPAGPAGATTLTWDQNGTGAGQTDGTGTWLNANQWWDSVGAVNATWNNTTPDDAIIGVGGAGGTITLGTVTAGSVLMNNFTGTYTLSGGSLTQSGGITIGSTAGNVTISSVIGGVGGLTKIGAGTLTLSGANTYTGATTLNAGTIVVSGAAGTIKTTTGATTFNGGALTLTYADSDAEKAYDRVADAVAITANGGTLTYTTTTAASTRVFAETIGAVGLTTGQFNIFESLNKTAGSQTLTLTGLTQAGQSTVTFSSPALNATTNMIKVSGMTGSGAGQNLPGGLVIGPWATTGTTAAAQTDYAVYDASGNVLPANITASGEATWTTAANAFTQGSTPQTLGGTRTMTALRNTAATATTALNGNALETYGLLNGVGTLWTISGTGALRTPTGGGNLFVTTGSGAITISAPITDSADSQPVTLVKSGTAGTLTLSGTNGYTGGTVLNAGTLAANSTASLPGYNSAGMVVFNGGTLQLPSAWAMADINDLVSNATKNSGALALDTTSGNQTQTAAWNLGALGLTKVGTGTLTLNQANTYTGATTVSAGTLKLSHANAIGGASGSLIVQGGGVVADTTVNLSSLTFTVANNTNVSGGTLAFAPGGTINQTVPYQQHTITSAITGSPTVNIASNWDAASFGVYKGLTFAPTSGTVTLGIAYVPTPTYGGDKTGLWLGGTTTGNSVQAVTFGPGQTDGTLRKMDSGTWTVGNVDVGTISIDGGTLVANGTLRWYRFGIFVYPGAALHYNNAGAVNGSFTMNGGSLDNSSGAAITGSTYNPAMAWNGDWTFIGSNGADSNLNLGTGGVTMNASRTVTVSNPLTTLTVGGVISGAGIGLTKAGAGTLILSGSNTYSGPTAVSAGTLSIGHNSALAGSALNTTLGSGVVTLSVTAPIIGGLNGSVDLATKLTTGYSSVTTLTLNPQAGVIASYSGAIANGAMNLTKTGAGTQILSGNNTYGGTTTVSVGTLVASSTSALPNYGTAGKVVLNGGTLQVPVDGVAWTMANVDTLLTNATKTSGTLGLDIASGTQTQSGAYNMGTVGLTKVGAGTLGLNLANTYTGATTINGGTLLLNGASGAIASSSGITVGQTNGVTGTLTLDNSSANNSDRVGSVAMGFNNGTLNYIGNATSASTETLGTITAAVGHNQLVLSGGASGQVAILTSTAGAVTRTAGATLNILADGTSQQFAFTGGAAGINKGVFYGATAATANDFAYYPGGGAAVTTPTYGSTTNFAADTSTALTAANHNRLNGSIASQDAVSIYSLNMPSNYSLTALNGNLTFTNAPDQGAIIKSGGGAAQIGTTGNAFDIVGQTGGELVVNTVDALDNLTLNVGVTGTTTALTKTGAGTLTLTANRDYLYTGATYVNAGTLVLNSLNTDGFKSSVTINNGGTAKLGASNKIVNTAVFTVNAGGTFDLAGFSERIGALAGSGSVANTGGAATLTLQASSTFSGVISGNTALSLLNGGTFVLSGQNTYSGATSVTGWATTLKLGVNNALPSGGVLNFGDSDNYWALDLAGYDQTVGPITMAGDGAIGVYNSVGASKLTLSGGATAVTTSNARNTAHVISVATLDLNNAAQTFTVNDTTLANDLTISSVIQNGALTKAGAGLLLLTGANTYAGATTVSGGTLSINSIGNVNGAASALGTPANVADGTVAIGTGGTAATLRYTGAGHTSDRVINLAGTTGGATIDASGTGALVLTSAMTATGAGSKTLTLTGSNTGNNAIGAIVNNSITNKTSVTKSGTGTWVLSGANTYTGNTTVSAGTLTLADNAQLAFVIGASGTNNKITGTGTLDLAGDFNFDFATVPAGTVLGNQWQIVDVGTLAETYQSTFSVTSSLGAFAADAGGDKWTKQIPSTSNAYEFTESTGILKVVVGLAPGDTNNDFVVDAADYITLKRNMGTTTGAGAAAGDFDGDTDVDWDDLQTMITALNSGGGQSPAVPEPATLGLLAIGALAVIRRRRK